jgi:hypothetical protein
LKHWVPERREMTRPSDAGDDARCRRFPDSYQFWQFLEPAAQLLYT